MIDFASCIKHFTANALGKRRALGTNQFKANKSQQQMEPRDLYADQFTYVDYGPPNSRNRSIYIDVCYPRLRPHTPLGSLVLWRLPGAPPSSRKRLGLGLEIIMALATSPKLWHLAHTWGDSCRKKDSLEIIYFKPLPSHQHSNLNY